MSFEEEPMSQEQLRHVKEALSDVCRQNKALRFHNKRLEDEFDESRKELTGSKQCYESAITRHSSMMRSMNRKVKLLSDDSKVLHDSLVEAKKELHHFKTEKTTLSDGLILVEAREELHQLKTEKTTLLDDSKVLKDSLVEAKKELHQLKTEKSMLSDDSKALKDSLV